MNSKYKYAQGQRWYSQTEPELGLGLVMEIEAKYISILFPLSSESRKYNITSHPLKRFILKPEDTAKLQDETEFTVLEVLDGDNVEYKTIDGSVIPEALIHPKIELSGAKDRLFSQMSDPNAYYNLRYRSQLLYRKYQEFPYRYFLGPNVRLIPHQAYIANEIVAMTSPKAMLCDEVGLGKTIEACLVLHALTRQERVKNTLIIVPESLCNQWFIELFKKFYLSFKVVDENTNLHDLQESSDRLIVSRQLLFDNPMVQEFVEDKRWDMLIIDEAHQIDFSSGRIFEIINKINQTTLSTLLLSATPEIIGEENLKGQLQFVDPEKFKDTDSITELLFPKEEILTAINELVDEKTPSNLDKLLPNSNSDTPQIALKKLIDKYGPGRSFYRNSKSNLQQYSTLFKQRVSRPVAIDNPKTDSISKIMGLKVQEFLKLESQNSGDKFLLITHNKKEVNLIHKHLIENCNLKIGTFTSEQSLLERDRQAAYFADPEGSQILISTEVGAEGRNFEFAHHLVLFDFPLAPDQMEQRIGRLDRIGQLNNIQIHPIYIKESFEEVLFRWYDEVLQLFTGSPIELTKFYSQNKSDLQALLSEKFNQDNLEKFITDKASEYKDWTQKIKDKKNILFDLHSYDHSIAKNICKAVSEFEENLNLPSYLDEVSHVFGLNQTELNLESINLTPSDNMLIPSFPSLPMEGFSYAITRDYAIKRDDLQFLSLEHPLIQGSFDLILHSNFGNISIASSSAVGQNILFEFIYSLQVVDQLKHISAKYLPLTPMRIVLGGNGADITAKFPLKNIEHAVDELPGHKVEEFYQNLPRDIASELIKKSHQVALTKSSKYIQKAIEGLGSDINHERERAKLLDFDDFEIKSQAQAIKSSIENNKIELDSIRIIIPV